jgi:hypothetical protein
MDECGFWSKQHAKKLRLYTRATKVRAEIASLGVEKASSTN